MFLFALPSSSFICHQTEVAPLFLTGGSVFTATEGRCWLFPLCRVLCNKSRLFSWGSSQLRAGLPVELPGALSDGQFKGILFAALTAASCLPGKENNPAARRYETQKADMWFTVDVYFPIFIFSHDRLSVLVCDHHHLYNYSYLTSGSLKLKVA